LAFPIAVKGTLKAPETTFTALSIDEGIFGIMKRTLLLPVYLVSPLLPKSRPAAAPATVTPTAQDR
jgi:hypothetical protein